jgi:hypothetical protein
MISRLCALWNSVFRRHQLDQDLDEELSVYADLLVAEKMQSGVSPDDARRDTRHEMGGLEQVRQNVRDIRVGVWLEKLTQDLRYGMRTLARSPGFTITAVLTLALGIGACTAIFSLVNAVLIRSLPYGDPERLVYLYTPIPRYNLPPQDFGPAYGDFYDIKRENRSFQSITAFEQSMFNLAEGSAQRVSAARVDGDFSRLSRLLPKLAEESLRMTINPVAKQLP